MLNFVCLFSIQGSSQLQEIFYRFLIPALPASQQLLFVNKHSSSGYHKTVIRTTFQRDLVEHVPCHIPNSFHRQYKQHTRWTNTLHIRWVITPWPMCSSFKYKKPRTSRISLGSIIFAKLSRVYWWAKSPVAYHVARSRSMSVQAVWHLRTKWLLRGHQWPCSRCMASPPMTGLTQSCELEHPERRTTLGAGPLTTFVHSGCGATSILLGLSLAENCYMTVALLMSLPIEPLIAVHLMVPLMVPVIEFDIQICKLWLDKSNEPGPWVEPWAEPLKSQFLSLSISLVNSCVPIICKRNNIYSLKLSWLSMA